MPSINKISSAHKATYFQNSGRYAAKHLLDRYDDPAPKKETAKNEKSFKDVLKDLLSQK